MSPTSAQRHRSSLLLALAPAVLLIAACGDDQRSSGSSARPMALRIAVSDTASGRYRYSAPKTIHAGLVRITLHNRDRVKHKAQLMRIGAQHTIAQAMRARRPPSWLYSQGGVGETRPGRSMSTIQRLTPGRYFVRGSGHEQGEEAAIRVVGAAGEAQLPPAPATITADEYSFKASGLRAGRNAVRFRNVGFQPHHLFITPVRRGATLADLRASFAGHSSAPPPDPPPVRITRGDETAVIEGQEQIIQLRLRRGRYALLCFVADRRGGPPHTAKGMIGVVAVP